MSTITKQPGPHLLAPRAAIAASLARYRGQPAGIRAFVRLRHLLAPLAAILARVPASGPLLDVGCGHGLFTNALALGSSERQVLGVDPSEAKIAVARASAGGLTNARYAVGTVEDVHESHFRAITILDVLYLLPVPEKVALLQACRERIAADGVLLVKTNDTRPAWKYRVAALQERAMTGVGLTMGQGLHFLSREQNAALLERGGFRPEIVPLRHWSPYPHVLFVGRPT